MHFNPKISIITVTFNAKPLIEQTIKSVITQSYLNIEYIIIDGGSSDGTLEIANQYHSKINILLSEKDNGIYDAMNKGLQHASGDYVLFLNAGDELYNSNILTNIFNSFNNADVYYGNTVIINRKGIIIDNRRLKPPTHLTWKSLQYGMCVSHQSFIARRSLCELYDTDYKISADIDWVIQVLKKSSKTVNTKSYISKYLHGGASNKHRFRALLERFVIMSKHYGIFRTVINHIYIIIRYLFHRITKKSMT